MTAYTPDPTRCAGHTGGMSRLAGTVIDHASRVLRAGGGRMTGPRRAVITALAQGDDHVTAEELVARVQAAAPGVNRSSVYRTLDALGRAGVVRHVHVNQGGTAYHLTGTAVAPHLHAQCQQCGLVLDLPSDLLETVRRKLCQTNGFVLDPGHVALSGTCQSCARVRPR